MEIPLFISQVMKMLKNNLLEERRKKISKDIDLFVEHSFDLADRIHDLLEKKGIEQKDLAQLLGKNESEISKWMTGTHNFTLKTISKIEAALGESILLLNKNANAQKHAIYYFKKLDYIIEPKKDSSNIPVFWNTLIQSKPQTSSNYLN